MLPPTLNITGEGSWDGGLTLPNCLALAPAGRISASPAGAPVIDKMTLLPRACWTEGSSQAWPL